MPPTERRDIMTHEEFMSRLLSLTDEQERLEQAILEFEDMLNKMPKNTVLGRLCIKAYLKRDGAALVRVKEKIEKLRMEYEKVQAKGSDNDGRT
jgi:hypothetical protein